MTDVPGINDPVPEDERDEEEETETTEEEGAEEETGSAEVEKWKKRASARDRRLREAQAEIARLKAKEEGGEEPDKETKANAKLVASAARTQLAAAGITDRDDQRAVIGLLRLDDIEVDEDGEVDEEALEERLAELRRILGAKGPAPAKRTPRVDTRDKGAGGKPAETDPDSARFRRILGQR